MEGWDRQTGDSRTARTSSSLWWRFLSCCSRSEGGPRSSSLSCLSRRLSSTRGSSALCRGRIPLQGQTEGLQRGHPHPVTQLGTVPSPCLGSCPHSPAVAEEQLPVQLLVAPGLPHRVWHFSGLDEAPMAVGGHIPGEDITPVTLWRGSSNQQGMGSPYDEVTMGWGHHRMGSSVGEGHWGWGHWGMGSTRGMGQPGTGSPGDGATCQHRVRSWTPAPLTPSLEVCSTWHPPRIPCVQVCLSPGHTMVPMYSHHPLGSPSTLGVPIISWGPNYPWGPHHPLGAHHPWCVQRCSGSPLLLEVPITPRSPSPLGSPMPTGSPSPLGSPSPPVPITPGVPNTHRVPIFPGVPQPCPCAPVPAAPTRHRAAPRGFVVTLTKAMSRVREGHPARPWLWVLPELGTQWGTPAGALLITHPPPPAQEGVSHGFSGVGHPLSIHGCHLRGQNHPPGSLPPGSSGLAMVSAREREENGWSPC